MSLAGAFTTSGGGLPETKAEKRAKAELKELAAFECPVWASAGLLGAVRKRAAAENIEATPVHATAIDLRDTLVRSSAIAKLPCDGGHFWACLAPKPTSEERLVLLLAQDEQYRLRAAAAWWPSARFSTGEPLCAADASKIQLLEDADGKAQPPLALGHPTVVGLGGEGTPEPASSELHGAAVLHLAEGVRLTHLARAQVLARLQRGGASADEKAHVKLLIREVSHRLAVSAGEEFGWFGTAEVEPTTLVEPMGLNRCESAAAGLRKMYLPRTWQSRCVDCGTRHTVVESGTCKFWVRWAKEAKEREAAATADPGAAALVEVPTTAAPVATPVAAPVAAPADAPVAVPADAPFEPFLPKLKQRAAREAEDNDKENAAAAVGIE